MKKDLRFMRLKLDWRTPVIENPGAGTGPEMVKNSVWRPTSSKLPSVPGQPSSGLSMTSSTFTLVMH